MTQKRRIIERAMSAGECTSAGVSAELGVSVPAASRVLRDLFDLGVLDREQRRSTQHGMPAFIYRVRRGMKTKHCSGCDTTKELIFFGSNRARPDGREGVCRVCRNRVKREQYTPQPAMGRAIVDWLATQDGPRTMAEIRTIAPELQARAFYVPIGSLLRDDHVVRTYVDGVAHYALGPKPMRRIGRKPRAAKPRAPERKKTPFTLKPLANTKAARLADAAREIHAKSVGVPEIMVKPRLMTSEEWLRANPAHQVQVLRNGDVSKASRFQRIRVAA